MSSVKISVCYTENVDCRVVCANKKQADEKFGFFCLADKFNFFI